jgi:hypothetical protein
VESFLLCPSVLGQMEKAIRCTILKGCPPPFPSTENTSQKSPVHRRSVTEIYGISAASGRGSESLTVRIAEGNRQQTVDSSSTISCRFPEPPGFGDCSRGYVPAGEYANYSTTRAGGGYVRCRKWTAACTI